jgi:hypothetical protein
MRQILHFLRFLAIFCLFQGRLPVAFGEENPSLGPLLAKFDMTLFEGHRTEALGPFFSSETKETQRTWAIPPLYLKTVDPGTESEEIDIVYPFLTLDRFGEQYRWELFQIFSIAGGGTQTETDRTRFTIFPIYFHQRSSDPAETYTAVFPIYGHLKNRLFRDEISFCMFPIYGQSRKRDVVTDNYLYPFYHRRHGNNLTGWQLWPFAGHEQKGVTALTNGFGDIEVIGAHDNRFVMWPFWFDDKSGMGTANPVHTYGSLPSYVVERSPQRDSTTVLWPLFTWIDDRERKYKERETPWPFVVVARGEGKHTTRFFPFFSHSTNAVLESDFYMWPVYKYNRTHSDPLDRRRTRLGIFVYSNTVQKNTETGETQRLVDFLPFYRYRRELDGRTRVQALCLLEPFFPTNKSIERDYSPLWSIWRAEKNPRTGASSQSLLWNLYRHETRAETKKCSLLFGLFQYQSGAEGARARLFYVPIGGSKPAPVKAAAGKESKRSGG